MDAESQDQADGESLYKVLEDEIIPLFYDRSDDYIPHGWVHRVKESIRTLVPMFNTRRMVKEYTTEMYLPAAMSDVFGDNGHEPSAPVSTNTGSREVPARIAQ